MRRTSPRWWAAALVMTAMTLTGVAPAGAHVTRTDGAVRLTIGWTDEPAYSGVLNSMSVAVTDLNGAPVNDPHGVLRVEVSFGTLRLLLALLPSGRPGLFTAVLLPTRAGTYGVRITGTISGQTIDTSATCSDSTFACVSDLGEVAFPAQDPPAGQLAARLDRELPRVTRAESAAATARYLSVATLAVAALALGAAFGLGVRRGRKTAA